MNNYDDLISNTLLFPEIYTVLTENRCFKVSINNRVSEDLHEWLKGLNLESLLLIPVFRGNKFWGSIGFGDSKNSRTWHNSEIQLQSLASAIGSAKESQRIKKEIETKNEVFNTTLSTLNEIVWEVNLVNNTSKVAGSTTFIQILKNEATNDNIIDWINASIHEDDKERVALKFKKFLEDKQTACYMRMFIEFITKKQESIFGCTAGIMFVEMLVGKPVSLAGTSVDISETKEVGFELSRQREQYQFLVQSLGQVVFTLDKNGKCSFVSPAWTELVGYKPEQSVGQSFYSVFYRRTCTVCFGSELNSLLSLVRKQVSTSNCNW